MAKNLGMSERTMIEKGLILGNSFQVIGRMIGRSPTTVSREVRKRRAFISRSGRQRNDCLHFISCKLDTLAAVMMPLAKPGVCISI